VPKQKRSMARRCVVCSPGLTRAASFRIGRRAGRGHAQPARYLDRHAEPVRRLPGAELLDDNGNPFDGARTYKVTLPKGIPAAKFWSITLYDNETRSMLQTPQKYPRAGSQSYPSPAAKPSKNGSTTVYIAPDQPEGVDRGN